MRPDDPSHPLLSKELGRWPIQVRSLYCVIDIVVSIIHEKVLLSHITRACINCNTMDTLYTYNLQSIKTHDK